MFLSAGLLAQANEKFNLIPYPVNLTTGQGSFIVNYKTAVILSKGAEKFKNEKAYLQGILQGYLGNGALTEVPQTSNAIMFKEDASITSAEGYRLTITPALVTLSAKSPPGMFYAVETLRQLLPADVEAGSGDKLLLPAVSITDAPAFGWRGMHLDVSRHFFSIAYLKKYVDMMALYKFNKLHLHLTDDQGWRIEIKKYPLLTSKSAWRSFNNQDSACIKVAAETGNTDFNIDAQHIKVEDGKTLYGGYYTQEEMKAFIAYAGVRHVEVIPEIDMPGHMEAASRVYPWLTCDSSLGDGKGFSNPVCPCSGDVLEFAKDVFSEIAVLFPSGYIHIGGDEVEMRSWVKSAACQQLMKEKGFTKPSQLQHYFNTYMLEFFRLKGKKMIGWDEVAEDGVDSSAAVMFWRVWAPGAVTKAARNNNKLIMTPDGPFYFDAQPDKNSLSDVYHYNLYNPAFQLTRAQQKLIEGVQANLWSEMVPTEQRADYMVMPRMTALAELGWTNKPLFTSYLQRLSGHYKRLDKLGVNYRLPDLNELVENNVFVGSTSFFTSFSSAYFTLRYTTDGSLPQQSSPIMDKPVNIGHSLLLRLALFTPQGRRGDVYALHFKASTYKQPVEAANVQPGLACGVYKSFFPLATAIKGTPDSVFTTTSVAVPAHIKTESFGLKFNGFIEVPATGVYTFYLNANDGAVLRIGNEQVIYNDGLHPDKEKGGQVALQKGLHAFAVDFMEGGGGYRLELKYAVNGSGPRPVPASWFKRPVQ